MNPNISDMIFNCLFSLFDVFAAFLFRCMRQIRIYSGPFQGMKYVRGAVGSSLVPKILGTYEKEVVQWIERLPKFSVRLDVGAAEGYYAVGLLTRKVCDRMIAWEMDCEGRRLMGRLAAVNEVEGSVDIRGRCDAEQLERAISEAPGRVLIIVDCEGFEGDLLTPISSEWLSRCDLMIETHGTMNKGVHQVLLEKLKSSHEILEVYPARRSLADLPVALPGILNLFKLPLLGRLAMSERRCPGLAWLLCSPKTK